MLLRPAPVSTRQLAYDPATLTFSGEVSSTNGLARVWDDAADEGLTLVSSRTNETRVFVISEVHYNDEGDLTHWTLKSVTGGFTLTLWND